MDLACEYDQTQSVLKSNSGTNHKADFSRQGCSARQPCGLDSPGMLLRRDKICMIVAHD